MKLRREPLREHGLVAIAGGNVFLDTTHAVFKSPARPIRLQRDVSLTIVARLFLNRDRIDVEDCLLDVSGPRDGGFVKLPQTLMTTGCFFSEDDGDDLEPLLEAIERDHRAIE